MRFEFYKQLMRESRQDFLVKYKSSIKLLEGNNKKMHKFKNCVVNKLSTPTIIAQLKLTFPNFNKLINPLNIEGAPITNQPLIADINDVEEWNDLFGSGGSNTIFDNVEIDGFTVILTGNIDAVTYLGYTTFDIDLQSIELSGFVNLQEFYGNKNVSSIIIDSPNVINYIAFNNSDLDDEGMKALLAIMSTTEVTDGSIDLAGFQTFTPDSETLEYIAILEGKGWSVSY